MVSQIPTDDIYLSLINEDQDSELEDEQEGLKDSKKKIRFSEKQSQTFKRS
jgi:hypothetical protein